MRLMLVARAYMRGGLFDAFEQEEERLSFSSVMVVVVVVVE